MAPRLDQQAHIHAVLHQICRCTSKMGRLVDFALRVFHVSLEGSVVSREEQQLELAQPNLARQQDRQPTNSSALFGRGLRMPPARKPTNLPSRGKYWKSNVYATVWLGGLTFRLSVAVEKWFKGVSKVFQRCFTGVSKVVQKWFASGSGPCSGRSGRHLQLCEQAFFSARQCQSERHNKFCASARCWLCNAARARR